MQLVACCFRVWFMLLFAIVTLAVSACDRPSFAASYDAACESVGLCDAPLPPPALVDVLCDGSAGSSCDSGTLGATLDVVLRRMADSPGSRVRVWTLGKTMAETTVLAERTVPPF